MKNFGMIVKKSEFTNENGRFEVSLSNEDTLLMTKEELESLQRMDYKKLSFNSTNGNTYKISVKNGFIYFNKK